MATGPDVLGLLEAAIAKLRVVLVCHPDEESLIRSAVDRLDPELLPGRIEVRPSPLANAGEVIVFGPGSLPSRLGRFERPFVNEIVAADPTSPPPPPAAPNPPNGAPSGATEGDPA